MNKIQHATHYAVRTMLRAHPEVVVELLKRLGLPYEEETRDGNLCFIHSEEVTPEYRQVFTATDVAHYLLALLQNSFVEAVTKENFYLNFPYPENAETFWHQIERGSVLMQHLK